MTAPEGVAPPVDDAECEFSSQDVCAIAHCSYRRLDYWLRTGRLMGEDTARGSGSRRTFTLNQVEQVSYAVGLIRAGFTADDALRVAYELVDGRSIDITVAEIVRVQVSIRTAESGD